MITDFEMRHATRQYQDLNFGVESGRGRLYLTTDDFGIDVNVSGIYARVESTGYSPSLPYSSFLSLAIGREIHLKCHIDDGFSILTRQVSKPSDILFKSDGRCLLVSQLRRPAPPHPAIWLPGGIWNCEFCSSAQLADLLQCRNCGAPRWGLDP